MDRERILEAFAGDVGQGERGDFDLNPEAPETRPGGRLTPAAVLVPLIDRPGGITVMLTKRTDHLHDHAGQVSFPGGRVEESDDGPVATALRETREEVGLDPAFVQVIGSLDLYRTVTGFRVTPVVGLVRTGFELRIDEFEVAEVFEVPLAFVLDPANHERESTMYNGVERHFYVLRHSPHSIWGATAGMLVNLSERLNRP